MEIIQITEEQEEKLITLFTKLKSLWIIFFIIGLVGFIPVGFNFFIDSPISFYTSPTFAFVILGIMFMGKGEDSIKKIKKKEYQVFKAKCQNKKLFEYALVENNEILSKKVRKSLKWISILGSPKSIQIGDDVGILKVDKDFWAFSLIG